MNVETEGFPVRGVPSDVWKLAHRPLEERNPRQYLASMSGVTLSQPNDDPVMGVLSAITVLGFVGALSLSSAGVAATLSRTVAGSFPGAQIEEQILAGSLRSGATTAGRGLGSLTPNGLRALSVSKTAAQAELRALTGPVAETMSQAAVAQIRHAVTNDTAMFTLLATAGAYVAQRDRLSGGSITGHISALPNVNRMISLLALPLGGRLEAWEWELVAEHTAVGVDVGQGKVPLLDTIVPAPVVLSVIGILEDVIRQVEDGVQGAGSGAPDPEDPKWKSLFERIKQATEERTRVVLEWLARNATTSGQRQALLRLLSGLRITMVALRTTARFGRDLLMNGMPFAMHFPRLTKVLSDVSWGALRLVGTSRTNPFMEMAVWVFSRGTSWLAWRTMFGFKLGLGALALNLFSRFTGVSWASWLGDVFGQYSAAIVGRPVWLTYEGAHEILNKSEHTPMKSIDDVNERNKKLEAGGLTKFFYDLDVVKLLEQVFLDGSDLTDGISEKQWQKFKSWLFHSSASIHPKRHAIGTRLSGGGVVIGYDEAASVEIVVPAIPGGSSGTISGLSFVG